MQKQTKTELLAEVKITHKTSHNVMKKITVNWVNPCQLSKSWCLRIFNNFNQ